MSAAPAARLAHAALVLAGIIALISAVSTPTPKVARLLAAQGLGPEAVTILMHGAPVLATAVTAYAAGMLALRLKRPLWKHVVRGGGGMVIGFVLAVFLDAFAALGPVFTRALGPLERPGFGALLGWIEGVSFLLIGLTLAALHVFGRSAVEVMNLGPVSDAQLPATRKEWLDNNRAAAGLLGMGVGLCALLLCVQAQAANSTVRAVLAAVAVVGLSWSNWLCWVLYRGMDEAMRLAVVRGYALSAVGATVVFTVWALAGGFFPIVGPTALDGVAILLGLQWVSMTLSLKSTFGMVDCELDEHAAVAPGSR